MVVRPVELEHVYLARRRIGYPVYHRLFVVRVYVPVVIQVGIQAKRYFKVLHKSRARLDDDIFTSVKREQTLGVSHHFVSTGGGIDEVP